MEPGELPSPVRERAQSEQGREIDCATAKRPVTVPGVENDVTVRQPRRNASGLVIEDLRTDLDLREIGGRDRAEGTGGTRVLRTLLRHNELSPTRGSSSFSAQ